MSKMDDTDSFHATAAKFISDYKTIIAAIFIAVSLPFLLESHIEEFIGDIADKRISLHAKILHNDGLEKDIQDIIDSQNGLKSNFELEISRTIEKIQDLCGEISNGEIFLINDLLYSFERLSFTIETLELETKTPEILKSISDLKEAVKPFKIASENMKGTRKGYTKCLENY